MGLSGRKEKQRIGADPRNLTWSDDAAKFGQAYLSKMGWNPSQGLGANGDGRTSHIKVAQKLNLLGIGAGAQQQGTDAVASSRDYEILLKRLNEFVDVDTKDVEETKEDEESEEDKEAAAKTSEKKRKASGEEGDQDKKERKKRKKEGKDKDKERKRDKKSRVEKAEVKSNKSEELVIPPDVVTPAVVHVPRPMAHRARFLRAKQLASKSSAAVSEILGITGSSSATPNSDLVSASASPAPQVGQELTTATKSVADYFKEKLAARALGKASVSALSSGDSVMASDEPLRCGIGSKAVLGGHTGEGEGDFDTLRPGFGAESGSEFGGLMGGIDVSSMVLKDGLAIRSNEEEDSKSKKDRKEKREKSKKKKEKAVSEIRDDRDRDALSTVLDFNFSNKNGGAAPETRKEIKGRTEDKEKKKKKKKRRKEEEDSS